MIRLVLSLRTLKAKRSAEKFNVQVWAFSVQALQKSHTCVRLNQPIVSPSLGHSTEQLPFKC